MSSIISNSISKKMRKSGPMLNFETVDDYIANQSKDAQNMLQELRELIKEAVPDCIEIQNYKVPSFTLIPGSKPEQQIMMAAYSKFVSFYPFPATIKKFVDELMTYKHGKGSVNFPFNKPLPRDLIIRMILFRKDEFLTT